PLHNPSKRVIYPERVFRDTESMDNAILNSIHQFREKGQPILVGTRSIRVSERISEKLEKLGLPHQVLTAKQDSEEEEIVHNSGEVGCVLIATNMAGRGTHIGLSDEAKANGGLHVIQVERNDSKRIDRQLVGRGARQGQPGSAQSFVCADDYLLKTYSPETAERLQKAKADDYGELSSSQSALFDQVQDDVEKTKYLGRISMAEHDTWLEDTKNSLAK
ncbi:MAG: hypothetical protein AAF226_14585, partial [Verrucomicrobiota bacterium]